MLHLPKRQTQQRENAYSSLGLTDLPFPTEAMVDPASGDPRRNGAIYAQGPVQKEIEKFEDLLIRPKDFTNRVKLASLWSKGDAQSGRGMGKTALLRFFQQRINVDWGYTEFDGGFSAVVIYVAFPSQIDRRYMEQLAWSALVDTCKNGVLRASRAALRRDALTDEQVASIVRSEDGEDYENLLDDLVLGERGVAPSAVDQLVKERLIGEGVESGPAAALSAGEFEGYLRGLRKDGNLEPYYVPYNTRGLDYARSLLFNDVVNYLRAAGFAGGYLFVDDIENLVDQMTRRQRLEFVKEFGLCTVRTGYANTTHNFLSCVMTTHQSSSVPLAQAWNEAGLSGMARLDPAAPTSVELPLPTQEQARDILVEHLDHFRLDEAEKGSIGPFTQGGMSALISASSHPRVLLSSAAHVVMYAVAKGAREIDENIVKEGTESGRPAPGRDFTEGLDDAL